MSEQGVGTHIPGEQNLDTSGAVLSPVERATAVGWYEKEDGLSAEDFLAKRDDHVGLLRKDVGKLEQKLAQSLEATEAIAEHMQKTRADAMRQGYDKAIADAKAEQKVAVEESDGDAYEQAARRIDQLEEGKSKIEEETIIKSPEAANPIMADIQSHQQAHPELFDTSLKAELWEKELRYQGTRNVSFEEAVAAADVVVRQTYLPSRTHLGLVDGEQASEAASSFADLPTGAEAAYQSIKRNNPDYTREEYLRIYNS